MAIALVLPLVVPACGGQPATGTTVVDSAGVEIVTTGAGTPVATVPVAHAPDLVIGATEGEPAYVLYDVTVARRSPDGRIAVAVRGAGEVRVFDGDGQHLETLGREGEGPGEYVRLFQVGWLAGGLWAYDDGYRRVTRYGSDGAVESTTDLGFFPLGGRDQTFSQVEVMADGRIVGLDWSHMASGSWPGVSLDTAFWAVRSPDGDVREIARIPGAYTVRFEMEGRQVFRTLPLTGRPSWTSDAEQLVYTSGAAYEIRFGDFDGRLRRIARRPLGRRPVDARVQEAWGEWMGRLVAGLAESAELSSFLAAVPMADSVPVYDALHLDPSGRVWAQHTTRGIVDSDTRWDLYAADGRLVAHATTPEGLRVTEIGSDYLLGVYRDPLGVEFVHLHRIGRAIDP